MHVLMSEPMNAQELMMYHFAAGGTRGAGGTAFLATETTPEEAKAGIETVGGLGERLQVVALPVRATWRLPESKQGLRVVLDSGSTFLRGAGWDDGFAQLKAAKEHVRKTGDTFFVSITTALHSGVELALLKQWADGVLELGFDRQGFGLYAFLKVTKMRGVPDSARLLLFRETENGLAVESTRRVF